MPGALRHRRHVVQTGRRDGVDSEEPEDGLEDLFGEIGGQALCDARDALGGGPADDGILGERSCIDRLG